MGAKFTHAVVISITTVMVMERKGSVGLFGQFSFRIRIQRVKRSCV